MASTLTWTESTGPTQTAATLAGFFADLDTMITANASNSAFNWKVGQYQNSNPYYITLVQKSNVPSGGNPAPVILIVGYTGAPAGVNTDIFDSGATITANSVHIIYFPSATTSTPSNLSSASGTVMGSDTNCVKACTSGAIASTFYAATYQLWYMDSADGIYLFSQTPNATAYQALGAGLLLVDYSGNAYAATCGIYDGSSDVTLLSNWKEWSSTFTGAGNELPSAAIYRTNYGTADSLFFLAFGVSTALTPWLNQTNGAAADILVNLATSTVYFAPIMLLGQTKGQGVVLKIRQIAMGPQTPTASVAFYGYYGTGNVLQAFAMSNNNASATSLFPWAVNFQV
jgi:hypothetical protein